MKHQEVLLLPMPMFSDYFLTLLGAVMKDKKYCEHLKTQHYELNPVWQVNIAQKKYSFNKFLS
ncbi:MAG TPA: hypothetical protein DET40_19560 [Lentisphaeria bacterium]|nr:MAG: hypothetical protein A2X45_18390 [Lentisphaerae bacterium GWF2_50_93]HCE45746.1 hypothetical protein [Lentisphaeria bacterium]